MAPKLLTEFIGTFFLCLAIALNPNAGVANLIAIGGMLMALIYAGGHISRAHYNPIVTLAFYLQKDINLRDGLAYIGIQLLSAATAALVARFIFLVSGSGEGVVVQVGIGPALMAEFLGTFALVFVIMQVAMSEGLKGNSFYGLAIAMVVIGGGYLLGPYSGAAFNPAVMLSQSILGVFAWNDMWIYLLGSAVGSVLAVFAYRLTTQSA